MKTATHAQPTEVTKLLLIESDETAKQDASTAASAAIAKAVVREMCDTIASLNCHARPVGRQSRAQAAGRQGLEQYRILIAT